MNQVRMGMIGVTARGSVSEIWHKPNGRLVVVGGMDPKQEALEMFKGRFKLLFNETPFTTTRFEDLLARDDINTIAITSPDFTHEEYLIKAFKAGKHVFCEKPLSISIESCDRMLKAWQDSGKHLMMGHNMRYMPIYRVVKDVVDSGVIGELKVVWVRHFVGTGGGYFHNWSSTRSNVMSLLLQKGSHDIDMIHWIAGHYTRRVCAMGGLDYYGGDKPNDLRCSACAEQRDCAEYLCYPGAVNKVEKCVFRKEIDIEDNGTVMMELENGIKATYMQCHFSPDYFRNYTFIGTEGRVETLDDHSRVMVKTRNQSKRWKNLSDQLLDVKQASGPHAGADPLLGDDIAGLILDGKKPMATPLAGRMSVAVGCLAAESMRHNSRVFDIPPLPENLKDKVY